MSKKLPPSELEGKSLTVVHLNLSPSGGQGLLEALEYLTFNMEAYIQTLYSNDLLRTN